MTGRRSSHAELTIGIIGPHDLVERIMLMGHGVAKHDSAKHGAAKQAEATSRLLASAYRDERDAPEKVAAVATEVDACLFAGPVSHEYATRAGVLTMPATHIPASGSALHNALLRASVGEHYDPARISIDCLERTRVEEAYAEAGMSARRVHIREDGVPSDPATIASFHERLWRRGISSVAVTGLQTVAALLEESDVPYLRLVPTAPAIRAALRFAELLGERRRLEDMQLALIMVGVPALRDASRRGAARYWREDLRLAVNRLLVQEAQRMHATAWSADDHTFMVVATRGSVAAATDGLRTPPFVERIRTDLGVGVDIGMGMGETAQEAEHHARSALVRARGSGRPAAGFVTDREGRTLVPAPRVPVQTTRPGPRGIQVLARLVEKMPETEGPLVVDAKSAGVLLEVTPRTARRMLRTLVEDGLAWPLPPGRSDQPGRPRQVYRLVVEKLESWVDTGIPPEG